MTHPAPASEPRGPTDDDLLRAAATPLIAKVAGGLAILAGTVTALTAVQAFTLLRLHGLLAATPYTLILIGATGLAAGTQTYRARSWAVTAQCIIAAAALCITTAWLFHSLTYNIVTLFALLDPVLWLIAAALAMAASGPCARATRARSHLSKKGYGLGV